MADDFGGGLSAPLDISAQAVNAMPDNSAPALDNSGTLPNKMPAPQPQASPIQQFGSALTSMLPGAHYASPDPGSSALDQSASLLQQRIDRASQIATNPLAQLFAPEQVQAARNFVPQATEQLRTIAQQKQQQVDIQKSATNFGMPASAQNPFMTNDTIDNWLLDQYKDGDFSKAKMLQARGRGDWVQDFAGQAVDGAGARLAAAHSAVTKLNAAGSNQPAYAATLRALTPAEQQSLTSLGLQTIPPKASDWQGVVQQHGAAFMQAQQLHSQVSQRLNNITNFDGTVPKDVETASQGDIRVGSTNEPAGLPVRTRSIDGQTGNVGPNGSVQVEKYGLSPKAGGWSVTTPASLAKLRDGLAGDDVKGAINQYNIGNRFKNEALNEKNYTSAYGLASIFDAMGGTFRDVAEKSAAAGNLGLSKFGEQQQGGFESFLNRVTNNVQAYQQWVRGGGQGAPPPGARISDETKRGIQLLAQENYDYVAKEAAGRLAGPMRQAGQYGQPLEDIPLDADLKASVAQYHEEGRVDAINGWRSYPSVVRGNQRVFFPQGANVNGANEPRPPLNTDGSPLTPVQQAGQNANAPGSSGSLGATRPVPPTGNQPSGSAGQPSAAPSGAPPQLDPSLVSAVKGFEGFTPKAQWDYKQRSNGYGTKAQSRDEVIDEPTANARLASELGNAQSQVDQFAPGLPPGPRKALTSLTYNAGPGWMKAGLGDAVKSGDLDKAQDLLLTYNKAGGKENPGLTARRQQEASWFEQPAAAQNTAPSGAAYLTPKQREAMARRGVDTSAAPRGLSPADAAALQSQNAQGVQNMAGLAAAALGTAGAIGGGAVGGPPGAVAGGALGGYAGNAIKSAVRGQPQNQLENVEEGLLSGVLGVASKARPILAAAGRVAGVGAIEAGSKAVEGGSGPEIVDAGLEGGAKALGGEALGRFVSSGGAAMYKAVSRYTVPAQQELMDHAGKLAAARDVLETEQPKLPGDVGPNPKYEAAKKQADDATAAIKDDHGQNPDDVVHAYEQATSGVSAGEAAVMRKAASEKSAVSQSYNQLRQDVNAAGVGTPKASQPTPDGPLAQIRTADNPTGAVEAKFAPDAQHAEMLVKAPAKDWGEKWQQLQNAGSELIQKRMAFLQNGDRPSADAMDGIFQGVRNQQKAAAEYVFGPQKGGQVISQLENLDQRYAKVMNATQGMDYGKMRSVIQAGNTPERRALEKNFTAFASDDPSAMRAFNAMKAGAKGRLTDEAKLMVPLITAESLAHFGGVPTLGVISATVGGHRLYKVMQEYANAKLLGNPVKFSDFFNRELQSSGAGQAVRGAVQRGAVQGVGASP